jgi:hypothetical protein
MNGKKRVMFHATSSLVDVSECEQSWADDDYNNMNDNIKNNSNMLQHQESYHDPTGMHRDDNGNAYKQVSRFQMHIKSYLQKRMCTACGELAAINNVYIHTSSTVNVSATVYSHCSQCSMPCYYCSAYFK